jgi:hypothetical protein
MTSDNARLARVDLGMPFTHQPWYDRPTHGRLISLSLTPCLLFMEANRLVLYSGCSLISNKSTSSSSELVLP